MSYRRESSLTDTEIEKLRERIRSLERPSVFYRAAHWRPLYPVWPHLLAMACSWPLLLVVVSYTGRALRGDLEWGWAAFGTLLVVAVLQFIARAISTHGKTWE
jgi:hypothetical protein